jgi:2-haloacid dehalogenase
MDRAGIPYTEAEVRFLVSCIERLKPFPEVPAALDRLRGRYRLAVLSNGDPDMLEEGRRHHGLAFDAVISVAEAGGAFKPHRATYTKAAELLGVRREEVLLVANHEFDVVGAKAGMRAAFVDRRRRPFARWPYQPDLVVPSMTALADALA